MGDPHSLTHWGRVTHICVSKLTIIGSDNGLSPGRRQAIIWTNAGILLIWTLWTNFSEIVSETHAFSFKKMHLKKASPKWRPFCLGLNVLTCNWSTTNISCIYAYNSIMAPSMRVVCGCFDHPVWQNSAWSECLCAHRGKWYPWNVKLNISKCI